MNETDSDDLQDLVNLHYELRIQTLEARLKEAEQLCTVHSSTIADYIAERDALKRQVQTSRAILTGYRETIDGFVARNDALEQQLNNWQDVAGELAEVLPKHHILKTKAMHQAIARYEKLKEEK